MGVYKLILLIGLVFGSFGCILASAVAFPHNQDLSIKMVTAAIFLFFAANAFFFINIKGNGKKN